MGYTPPPLPVANLPIVKCNYCATPRKDVTDACPNCGAYQVADTLRISDLQLSDVEKASRTKVMPWKLPEPIVTMEHR